jgi:alcohol dehydrogenase
VRGLTLDGVHTIRHRSDLPDPQVEGDEDAVVRVVAAGLCGSDLHPYEGREPVRWGVVPGHELVGEVVAVGAAVTRVAVGQRVLAPFTTSCGRCHACREGLSSRCVHGQLFGYGPPDHGTPLEGAQAEFVRVPLADDTLVAVPDGIDDATAVLLCDNLPTGWYAARRAEVRPGTTVVVVGAGAVGLCAVTAAFALGAARVVAVDPVADRRERAEALGAVAAAPDEGRLRELLDHGSAPCVVEAAGVAAAQRLAAAVTAPGGTLSVIAVQTDDRFAVSPAEAYDGNLTLRLGRAPVRSLLDELLPAVTAGRVTVPTATVVTHPDRPLADGPTAYGRFAAREPGLVKLLFRP